MKASELKLSSISNKLAITIFLILEQSKSSFPEGENIKGLHKYCEFYKERSSGNKRIQAHIQAPISKSLKGIDNTTASC